MHLKKIIDKDKDYVVETESPIRFIGIRLFTLNKVFRKDKQGKEWIAMGSKSKVSGKAEKKLNFWISQHEKFVVGQI